MPKSSSVLDNRLGITPDLTDSMSTEGVPVKSWVPQIFGGYVFQPDPASPTLMGSSKLHRDRIQVADPTFSDDVFV